REDRAQHLAGGLFDYTALARIAFDERLTEIQRLFEGDVWRQGRDFGIGLHFQYHRTPARERLVPGAGQRIRAIHVDTLQPDQLGKAMIRDVGDLLGSLELRIAFHHSLLPRDLV